MPLRLFLLLFLVTGFARILPAQAPYTEKQYAWSVEKDLVYGVAVNYLGRPDTLTLDLYKPLNADTTRPVLVLVHGGAWVGGCKENMAWLCEEMAARGYVTATVNYRKGWHKDDYVPNPINPGIFPGGNCLYSADSMEIIRAIYRGAQDVKGAIRWLKARVYADSSCNHAVLVGGESAGGFIALTTALLDRPEEKPAACGALPDAPVPGANLSNCYAVDCINKEFTVTADARKRPDLGPVDGTMNQNGFDARGMGVLSFYGALPVQALPDNWVQGPDTPAIYLYHQTCDGVVPFGYGNPYFVISNYCNLGFTPWHYTTPHMFGNGAIAEFLKSLPHPPPYLTDFLPCPAFDPNLALFECLRYNDNGSYHYTHNPPERAVKIAAFFSPLVAARLGSPPCLVSTTAPAWAANLRLAPNPFREAPVLYCDVPPETPVHCTLSDSQGRPVWQGSLRLQPGANALDWPVENLCRGLYFLRLAGRDGVAVWRAVCQR